MNFAKIAPSLVFRGLFNDLKTAFLLKCDNDKNPLKNFNRAQCDIALRRMKIIEHHIYMFARWSKEDYRRCYQRFSAYFDLKSLPEGERLRVLDAFNVEMLKIVDIRMQLAGDLERAFRLIAECQDYIQEVEETEMFKDAEWRRAYYR